MGFFALQSWALKHRSIWLPALGPLPNPTAAPRLSLPLSLRISLARSLSREGRESQRANFDTTTSQAAMHATRDGFAHVAHVARVHAIMVEIRPTVRRLTITTAVESARMMTASKFLSIRWSSAAQALQALA